MRGIGASVTVLIDESRVTDAADRRIIANLQRWRRHGIDRQ